MKKSILFVFITFFALASFACTEVGTNNKVANGDLEVVEEKSDSDKIIEDAIKENVKNKIKSATEEEKPKPSKAANSPEAVVENLYKEEENENNPFFQNENRALVDRFFTKDLADMIWKDSVETKDDDVGALDFDPLYDAQDAEVADLKVGNSEIHGEKATVTVTFLNFGEEQSVKYQLAKENDKWKIADINYKKETLKQIFKQGKRTETETEEN